MIKKIAVGSLIALSSFFVAQSALGQTSTPTPTTNQTQNTTNTTVPTSAPSTGFGG